ncbi:cysteine hydrolase family protein [Candidatus Enterococcus courvalinii]|uniref:Cysteine hydrolase n=1 Tax=Candidatus Enterococcus courvalinii TaxID=2815329 RepID=A0ABS3HXH3_9ENTE|nr:cysteine hydrolase family protein [Enterococcus sp. MSG2901]MBO0481154.1 cysteine hydrolase [Enterococcus sp. MSG2901]
METQLCDALVVIDLQNGVCYDQTEIFGLGFLTKRVNERILLYKEQQKQIIFVQHCDKELISGTTVWEILPEIIQPSEARYVEKTHADAFFETTLQELLIALHVQTLEICGAQTEYCVDTSIKVAHHLGYQVKMLPSLTTTYDNPFMSAQETIAFYEKIWDRRFVEFMA